MEFPFQKRFVQRHMFRALLRLTWLHPSLLVHEKISAPDIISMTSHLYHLQLAMEKTPVPIIVICWFLCPCCWKQLLPLSPLPSVGLLLYFWSPQVSETSTIDDMSRTQPLSRVSTAFWGLHFNPCRHLPFRTRWSLLRLRHVWAEEFPSELSLSIAWFGWTY